ncbi:MAG: [FeFe] hydrogenase H-cluster radical SAM maturase HydE [Muribaculaceae bacterium]|nr:[FeFe] hydrogenase H-cluster radical SAM maturase HydE [Muribaculaceae bacterium]
MRHLVDTLRESHHLNDEGYEALLTSEDAELLEYLRREAQRVATSVFGQGIFVRGLIELTNVCRNDCYYCGIRRSNVALPRYILTHEQVMQSCQAGHELGFRTFVLQGGELPREKAPWIAGLVADIRARWSDCAITLSLGEWPREDYELFRNAGADRYLLRHESHNAAHYAKLHPREMSLDNRLRCLNDLRELGFQTGTGIMVGSPGQTIAHIVEDIKFIELFKPQMIGLGPFVPHHDTPLGQFPAGSIDLTTRLYSIFRLMFPHALIPSTTALNSLHPEGRVMGIRAGANVVMPNLTPASARENYTLYDGKAITDPAEGIQQLETQLNRIGYHIDWGRGDYKEPIKTL